MDDAVEIKRLVEKAKKYDKEAFGELYDRYFDKVFAYVYYKIGNRFDAEDIAGQVFLKALESIKNFEWRGVPFSAWLFRIASNLIVDYYRSTRYKMVDIEEEADTIISHSNNPEQSAIQAIDRKEIVNALKNLTDEQQQVVVMRFVFGMTNEEVAQAVSKNVGAVKALQYRAIGALGRVLGRVYDESRS